MKTARLCLRAPLPGDAPEVAAYFLVNAVRFAPWNEDFVRGESQAGHWIAHLEDERSKGGGMTLFAFEDGALRGIVRLYSIAPDRSHAMLAYSVDGAREGRGYALEAVEALIAHAFGELGLAELVAHAHAENARSIALMRRAGFSVREPIDVPPEIRPLMRPQVMGSLSASAWASRRRPPTGH